MRTPLDRIRLGAIVLAIVLFVAVCGYVGLGYGWLEATYMVVITVATVGFGEHTQLSPEQQVWTILVIVFGISAAGYTLGGLVQMMTAGEIERILGTRRMTHDIEALRDHVIVCGFGRIGQTLAEELKRRHRRFVVIDQATERVNHAASLGHLAMMGDATQEEVLVEAGVARAQTLVTALQSDAANVFITLTSRNLNRGMQIIARGEQLSTQKKLIQAGADRVVLPATIGAQRIAMMITHPSTIELMELVLGRTVLDVEIDEVALSKECPLVGKTVGETETRRRHRLIVMAVKRADGQILFNPDDDFTLTAGDTAIVLGKPDDIARFRKENRV